MDFLCEEYMYVVIGHLTAMYHVDQSKWDTVPGKAGRETPGVLFFGLQTEKQKAI